MLFNVCLYIENSLQIFVNNLISSMNGDIKFIYFEEISYIVLFSVPSSFFSNLSFSSNFSPEFVELIIGIIGIIKSKNLVLS